MQTKRKPLTKAQKAALVESQGGLCFYCFNAFGTMFHRGQNFGYLMVNIDHAVPHSYMPNGDALVAACHICNLLKSNKMFDTVEDARVYVQAAWQRKKISIVS